ncbi:MAG: SDR family NAD(P)-dependent oxidoreductase [Dehalococcoidia bacterium]
MSDWGPFSLQGKSAIVTGGALGIGYAIAARLLEAGAKVLVADLDPAAAEAAAARLAAGPGGDAARVAWMRADVASTDAGPALVARAVDSFGGVDILVNNAGIYPFAPALEMTPEFFDRVIAVNLRGTVLAAQAAARQMVAQARGGRIINIASVDGLHPSMVGLAAYDASKGGVVMFTKNLALEMAPHGVLVNAIAPGGVDTDGVRKMQGLPPAPLGAEPLPLPTVPLGRMARADEIATVVVFLASPAANYMTGEIVVVDGGMLIS